MWNETDLNAKMKRQMGKWEFIFKGIKFHFSSGERLVYLGFKSNWANLTDLFCFVCNVTKSNTGM